MKKKSYTFDDGMEVILIEHCSVLIFNTTINQLRLQALIPSVDHDGAQLNVQNTNLENTWNVLFGRNDNAGISGILKGVRSRADEMMGRLRAYSMNGLGGMLQGDMSEPKGQQQQQNLKVLS
jgi:hypothetical protein